MGIVQLERRTQVGKQSSWASRLTKSPTRIKESRGTGAMVKNGNTKTENRWVSISNQGQLEDFSSDLKI